MTADKPHPIETIETQHTSKPVSKFWQECDRYHDLAEAFTRDIVITHPNSLSGRLANCPSPSDCCGYCTTTIKYYEHIPNARHSTSTWH